MQLTLEELDCRLDSLDAAVAQMVEDGMDRGDLLVVIACAGDQLLELSGSNHEYVSDRLLAILIANGLGTGQAADQGPT